METRLLSIGMGTTLVLHGLLIALVVTPPSCDASEANAESSIGDDDMVIIEAAIAYKKQEVPKQPQKKRSARKKKPKIGVSRDADKVAKDDPKKAEPSWQDFKRDYDEEDDDDLEDPDLEPGKAPPRAGGSFDGKEYGWADENKGHPYMQELVRQVDFDVPTLEKGKGFAVACIRLDPAGTINETKLRTPSGITNIDRAAEETLSKLEKAREDPEKVEPVPSELIPLTNKWLCFKLGL
jgi:hypothetical protein